MQTQKSVLCDLLVVKKDWGERKVSSQIDGRGLTGLVREVYRFW